MIKNKYIQWTTDIHLNRVSDINGFLDLVDPNKHLVITGDIGDSKTVEGFLRQIANHMQQSINTAYFVLGHHDFYGDYRFVTETKIRILNIPSIHYLSGNSHPIHFGNGIFMVGVNGWADGGYGNINLKPDAISDYSQISEYFGMTHEAKKIYLSLRGLSEAKQLEKTLLYTLTKHDSLRDQPVRHIIVATHVPPFEEAHLYQGMQSDSSMTPHFTCKHTGDVLLKYAKDYPDVLLEVFCGHTHHSALVCKADNLIINVGGAEYGNQKVYEIGLT
jgi:UDP-2,3-diacylglucosamine pyrophosphatase LpxH